MAKDLLPVPASSADSERAFSIGRHLFAITRYSLKPETIEASVCLRSWVRANMFTNLNDVNYVTDILERADSEIGDLREDLEDYFFYVPTFLFSTFF